MQGQLLCDPFGHDDTAAQHGLRKPATDIAAIRLRFHIRAEIYPLARDCPFVVPPQDDNAIGIKGLDHVRRVRGDEALSRFRQEIARNSPLGVGSERDLRLLHGEDDVLFLELGDETQKRQHQRVKRSVPTS